MIFKRILEGSERKIGKTLRATVGYQKSVVPQKPSENSVSRRRGQLHKTLPMGQEEDGKLAKGLNIGGQWHP